MQALISRFALRNMRCAAQVIPQGSSPSGCESVSLDPLNREQCAIYKAANPHLSQGDETWIQDDSSPNPLELQRSLPDGCILFFSTTRGQKVHFLEPTPWSGSPLDPGEHYENEICMECSARPRRLMKIIGDGCHVVDGCVRSRNYPSSYSDHDTCTILNLPAHPISVTSFDVENANQIGCIWDHLTVNNRRYCGTNSPEGVVPDGTPIEWKADYSVTKSGWEICFRPEVKTAMLTGHTYAACQGIYSKSDDMLNGKPIWDRTTGSRFIFWCGGAWRVTGSQWRQAFLNLQIGHCGAFISSKTATGDAVEHWWAADWSNNGAGIGAIPLV